MSRTYSYSLLVAVAVIAVLVVSPSPASALEPFIGEIVATGFNFPMRGWALCNGQLLAISQNNALFQILGTTYGGDGRTTFGLPDLRGRTPIHAGFIASDGVTYRLGEKGGTEEVTLTTAQMPSHSHSHSHTIEFGPHTHDINVDSTHTHSLTAAASNHSHTIPIGSSSSSCESPIDACATHKTCDVSSSISTSSGGSGSSGATTTGASTFSTLTSAPGSANTPIGESSVEYNAVGDGNSHNNMQPFLSVTYQIALQGIFPSRN
jgi:microcystin-dependent protein